MAPSPILIDTSIFIEHLRKQKKETSILYNVIDAWDIFTSVVVEFELYAGAIDRKKQRDVEELLAWCVVLPMTPDVAQSSATIYRQMKRSNQLIDVRDIFIGATAVVHNLPLMTLNQNHFSRVNGLQLMTPPQF